MNFSNNSVRLAQTCYMTVPNTTLQTGLRAISSSAFQLPAPRRGVQSFVNQSDAPDLTKSEPKLEEARFVQSVIRTSKRPPQISTKKIRRSNSINSPLSPEEGKPEPKRMTNMHSRKFSSSSAIQFDTSKLPGIVAPEFEHQSPSFQYHETWSYLKRNEPNMVV